MSNEEMKYSMNMKKLRKRNEPCLAEQRQGLARPFLIFAFAFLISHFSFHICNAQTFTQRLQKQVKGEGIVTIYQDKAIEELVNGQQPVAIAPATTTKATAAKPANKKSPMTNKPATKKQDENKQPANRPQQPDTASTGRPQEPDTLMGKPKRTYRTTGYRVQAFAGGNSRRDRQRAEHIGNQLRALFPEHQVYVHFYSPRWICRIGNFKAYDDAAKLKNELKELGFGTATIVKGKISLQY